MIAFSLFQVYKGIFAQYTAYIQRTVHLGFAIALIFLLFPARRKKKKSSVLWYDYLLVVLSIIVYGYWPVFYDTLVQKIGGIDGAQMIIGGIAILLVLEAARRAVGLPKEEILSKKSVLKKIYLLLPILAIEDFLFVGMSIERAALYGILSTILVSLFRKDTRITPSKFIVALETGARTALGVATATACAGIIVGVVTKTGLGLKMGNSLVSIAGGIASSPETQLLLTLFFTMIASIILGMGSPTTANYIIMSTIALPAILVLNDQLEVAIPVLAAHMFVFYFGILADITRPVALAAFAATGISGGEPIRTGINASKLAIAAFIIPYMFVLNPTLLMIGGSFIDII